LAETAAGEVYRLHLSYWLLAKIYSSITRYYYFCIYKAMAVKAEHQSIESDEQLEEKYLL